MAEQNITMKARNESGVWDTIYPKTVLAQIIGLLAGGKIDPLLIPQQAITDVFEAASDSEMIALSTAHAGDVCIRSDVNKTFILKAVPYSTLENWVQLPIPQDLVLSVAGKTGAVTLGKSDVDLGNVDNTADSAKNVASAAKLTTARTISGVSFDGTEDITLYNAMTEDEAKAGTETATRIIAPNILKAGIVALTTTVTAGAAEPVNPKTDDLWFDYNNA
ncbi:MAG: hypothetical protein LBK23_09600 [Oscillospiraceae bacterium]|jgi:hypothetical protein|nr:hypothetical protein [Oscillospiraceae bacterium]